MLSSQWPDRDEPYVAAAVVGVYLTMVVAAGYLPYPYEQIMQALLMTIGVIGVLAGMRLLWLRLLPERPEPHQWVEEQEQVNLRSPSPVVSFGPELRRKIMTAPLPQHDASLFTVGRTPGGATVGVGRDDGHFLLVGDTGTGKSSVVNNFIAHLVGSGEEVHGGDLKLEMVSIWGERFHVAVDAAGIEEAIRSAQAAVTQRMAVITAAGPLIRSVTGYENATGGRMPRRWLVLDEGAYLLESAPHLGPKLVSLLQTGRAAGVYVCLSAQYLTAAMMARAGSKQFSTRLYIGRYDGVGLSVTLGQPREELKAFSAHMRGRGTGLLYGVEGLTPVLTRDMDEATVLRARASPVNDLP